jgi:hypothetical protein
MSTPNMAVKAPEKTALLRRGVNYATKQARMAEEERELEEMLKEHLGEPEAGDVTEAEEVEVEEPKEPVKGSEEPAEEDTEAEEEDDAEEKSFKKRYGDLRSHMAKKEKAWKEREAELQGQISSGDAPDLRSEEDVSAWVDKNPEVASMVEAIAERKAEERFSEAQIQIDQLDEARTEADRVKAENSIRNSHKDFDELRESDEFHSWVDAQPKWIQDALYENSDDAKSVIRVLDLYKSDNNLTPVAKKQKAKDAATSSTRSPASRAKIDDKGTGGQIKESDVEKMSPSEFDARYEEIQTAIQSGKFVYDRS